MEIDMMQAVAAVIGLLGVILTNVAVPLIKSKMNDSQWELIGKYALAAVQAAEILFNGTREGAEKFNYAAKYIESQCVAHGIKIDMATVRIAIENAWKALGLDKCRNTETRVGF